ncbi:MBL fold metallo-hydrolase [Micromonospora sp. NPDC049559]|uniref:MBL fold metallo-hydrolase n=1 Tax=Micromonospora sp. NPDC049559 TaxID=3155923 RepID=UPI00342C9718
MGAGRRRRSGIGRGVGLAALGALVAGAWAVRGVPAALGGRAAGDRADRIQRSPQFRAGVFRNPVTSRIALPEAGRDALRELLFGGERRRPAGPVPLVAAAPAAPATAPPDELNIIWYGHASALIEIEGRRVLVDPIWSDRCSPAARIGPRRLHPPPVPLERLPPVDAVLISHDHYDHLDMATVRALARAGTAPFLVPLGVGAHLERWGVPAARVVELDWTESVALAGLTITATAAYHFSGRGLARDRTLWGSWVVAGARRRVFYSGDSGYFEGYAEIGAGYGPFDAALVQVGAYDPAWPNMHMFPEEAVAAHRELRGGLLVPMHWGTFNLARHAWSDPVERLWREAQARGVSLAVPRPGERVRVDDPPPVDGWWRSVA